MNYSNYVFLSEMLGQMILSKESTNDKTTETDLDVKS